MGQPLSADIEFLEHFGVKGMRWGVRKDRPGGVTRTRQGYANRKQRKADRIDKRVAKRSERASKAQDYLDRVAHGRKTGADIVKMFNTVTVIDIATAVSNKESLGKAYASNRQPYVDRYNTRTDRKAARADSIRAHAERIRNGEGTTKDMLKFYGGAKLIDTIRG